LLKFMDKHSDNFFAEMLTKGLGASFRGKGSTAAGVLVTRAYLASVGLPATTFRLYDGSGLSYWDRLSAIDIERLLRGVARRPDASVFVSSLSVAGVDGTLRRRMRNTAAQANLVAKTGSLKIACCLSGFVTSANGHRVIFSMLMNGDPVNYSAACHVQDTIGVALAKARLPAAVSLSPVTPPA
jgi:D-alanyl-D-alanine carboxypeptidase/D-alanyl-D-alanine-endopeptidase (penicillin-binding protein 4)